MSQARRFQDELPLIHNCPAFNELRLAEELTDVIIEVNFPACTVLKATLGMVGSGRCSNPSAQTHSGSTPSGFASLRQWPS
ncbi:unnamed protein product [Dibothriocephalus latus]|uniref:Uncharacterized protein n=1 Tax=Dibothriocephalus latus TaxID=60516 RepID=A0A3P7P4D8_DIBLA|nr:unnamed protein product [Dibothriocephalus latus]